MGPVTTAAGAPPAPWQPALLDLYRSDYPGLVRLAVLVGADRSVAEELVQDAFVAAHRTWDGVRDPLPYLRRAVVNRCHSWGRRQVLERDRRPAPAPDASLGADELWDALATLPHRQRTAIVARYYLDLPDPEIADLLGCRPATVRTAIHRGLAALRKEVPR
jgi:RNA polymerase sigma factor (sigma-70 family)